MQHETLTLVEEKQLIKEIKLLEGTREKVIANATEKAKIQDSYGHRDAIQGQVKVSGNYSIILCSQLIELQRCCSIPVGMCFLLRNIWDIINFGFHACS